MVRLLQMTQPSPVQAQLAGQLVSPKLTVTSFCHPAAPSLLGQVQQQARQPASVTILSLQITEPSVSAAGHGHILATLLTDQRSRTTALSPIQELGGTSMMAHW